jgi:hypothetical protein
MSSVLPWQSHELVIYIAPTTSQMPDELKTKRKVIKLHNLSTDMYELRNNSGINYQKNRVVLYTNF